MTFPRTFVLLMLSLLLPAGLHSEHLPVRTYTTADGLASDFVNQVVQDSHGYLWFCTGEGLSRFDGYTFTNYTTENGLPHRNVTCFLETQRGDYWVGTDGGLCRFDPRGTAVAGRPIQYCTTSTDSFSKAVTCLIQEPSGAVLCGTISGLYQIEPEGKRWHAHIVHLGVPEITNDRVSIGCMLFSRQGTLWVGTALGLCRMRADRTTECYGQRHGIPTNGFMSMAEDLRGRIWLVTWVGALCELVENPDTSRTVVERLYTSNEGLPSQFLHALHISSKGDLWIGAIGGLGRLSLRADARNEKIATYTTAHGLSNNNILAVTEDREGNLWLGSESGGAMKLAQNGLTSYGENDGIIRARITSMFEDSAGTLYAVDGKYWINQFDGVRFRAVHPKLPDSLTMTSMNWEWYRSKIRDQRGDWWIPTGKGIYRFPQVNRFEDLATTAPIAHYGAGNGAADHVIRLYKERSGNIWISALDDSNHDLFRWEARTGRFTNFSSPTMSRYAATAFCEDSLGNLWLGFYGDGIARFRDGTFQRIPVVSGAPTGMIKGLYAGRNGRLWIASDEGGVAYFNVAQADHPAFTRYTIAQGLSSNDTRCIVEDRWGQVYVGTGRGIDRIDPETNRIKHFTTADGLANNEVDVALRDRNGTLWFGTFQGLSRLTPVPDRPQPAPAISITGVRINGIRQAISELGEIHLTGFEFGPEQNNVQVEYVSIAYGMGELIRYQYMLEGADAGWSPPSYGRSISFAHLSPGSYRFIVKALNSEGAMSERPAILSFEILPPFWQRRWVFFPGLVLAAGVLGFWVRYLATRRLRDQLRRVEREQAIALERERVRSRIARDLHDDLGATLGSITLYSEAMKEHAGHEPDAQELAGRISSLSSQAQDALGDVIWSSAPQHDTLSELLGRIRRMTMEQAAARGIQCDLRMEGLEIPFSDELRRNIFLIFKEALNNAIKHSQASRITVSSGIDEGVFHLTLIDNGIGLPSDIRRQSPPASGHGHGLHNMQKRAMESGCQCSIDSLPGKGTTVTVRVKIT